MAVPPDGSSGNSDDAEEKFGVGGWVLVVAVIVAFVIVPGLIYLRPPGLPFVVAYLILPLVPAVLLALLAVWITT